MNLALNYIPMDRRQALAAGTTLPDRTYGAALFADISGFTPLAEALVRMLGPQRGAEELTRQLNLVFDPLITEIDHYGGSVISFSGDALTCWFDDDDGQRATASALAMQRAMGRFARMRLPGGGTVTLAMKVVVAIGAVRRFVVGDPAIQVIDVLAGATLDRLAEAEHWAQPGELLIDEHSVELLGELLSIAEWREGDRSRFAVVRALNTDVPTSAWPELPANALNEEQVRPWVLPAVYQRLRSGEGAFLAELRPSVALFLSFGGIDYDRDEAAEEKLDTFVRWVQGVVTHYEGTLVALTMGDKGSYMHIAFGAPIAHDDDAARAVSAAEQLRALPPELEFISDVQIGISRGRMRTGPYGGQTRSTYGVLGDEVNLAARLMQHAERGQVLASQRIADVTRAAFVWKPLPEIMVKGKSDPISIFALATEGAKRIVRPQEAAYTLPMVGRERELTLLERSIEQVMNGQGQIAAITGEAGMGKSRLLAELIHRARACGFTVYSGECQSYGTNSAYLVWRGIWRAFFEIDENAPRAAQVEKLEEQLAALDPSFVPRLPLLAVALNLSLPENELTQSLDAKLRKESLEMLLADCLKARASANAPLLLVLEDCHWLDPLSRDLLEVVGRVVANLPVLVALAYRTPLGEQSDGGGALRVSALPHFTEIPLTDISPAEGARLIELKLTQFGDSRDDNGAHEVPAALVERINERAQGNPFYIEELINYLHGRGLDPRQAQTLEWLEWPDSLHSLILSRIDQLSESQKITLKVASIIGRMFRFDWLWGVYPPLGMPARVADDIERLQQLDLTPLEAREPELRYMFKHIVTQEVAYDSQPYAVRSELHEHLGRFIEKRFSESTDKYLDLLAYHYGRSNNLEKQKEYYAKAGAAAAAAYAPEAAIGYYQKALALLLSDSDPAHLKQRFDIYEGLGKMLIMRARYQEALDNYAAMRSAAEAADDVLGQARAWYGLASAQSTGGEHRAALESAERAESLAQRIDARLLRTAAMEMKGRSLFRLGDTQAALALAENILRLTSEMGDRHQMGRSLNLLGAIHYISGRYQQADDFWMRALTIFQDLGDRSQVMTLLNNLGVIASAQGEYQTAFERYERALGVARELGHRDGELVYLSNLGAASVRLHAYLSAEAHLRAVIRLAQQVGSDANADTYNFLAEACLGQDKVDEALSAARRALALGQAAGLQSDIGATWRVLGLIAAHTRAPLTLSDSQTGETQHYDARECFAQSLRIFSERRMDGERTRTLAAWAKYELEQGDRARGVQMCEEAHAAFVRLGAISEAEQLSSLLAPSAAT